MQKPLWLFVIMLGFIPASSSANACGAGGAGGAPPSTPRNGILGDAFDTVMGIAAVRGGNQPTQAQRDAGARTFGRGLEGGVSVPGPVGLLGGLGGPNAAATTNVMSAWSAMQANSAAAEAAAQQGPAALGAFAASQCAKGN
jgi:hypothetical protein